MSHLDKFRYSYDDPSQLNISLKKDPYEKVNDLKSNNLNQLLSTSVKVTKEIFPEINKAIDNVFKRLKIENNLNFFGFLFCFGTVSLLIPNIDQV